MIVFYDVIYIKHAFPLKPSRNDINQTYVQEMSFSNVSV